MRRIVAVVGAEAAIAQTADADVEPGHPTDMNAGGISKHSPIVCHAGIPAHAGEISPILRHAYVHWALIGVVVGNRIPFRALRRSIRDVAAGRKKKRRHAVLVNEVSLSVRSPELHHIEVLIDEGDDNGLAALRINLVSALIERGGRNWHLLPGRNLLPLKNAC